MLDLGVRRRQEVGKKEKKWCDTSQGNTERV